MKLKTILNEAFGKDKVYMLDNTLWVAYGPGSGNTKVIRNINSYLTDKPSDKNYDYTAELIVKWSSTAKAMKKKDAKQLFKIPIFRSAEIHDTQSDLAIWGGEAKPKKYIWLVIVKEGDMNIIHLFYKKNEAEHWLKN